MGADPVWSISNNKLVYINSIKMKMSVIFGVLHMSMGIAHKGMNTIYWRQWVEFITEVVLGFVILWSLFGWMDLLIITKFFTIPDIDAPCKIMDGEMMDCPGERANAKQQAIIQIMITTYFSFGVIDDKTKGLPTIIGKDSEQMYTIAVILYGLFILSVPFMLCTKPCLTLCHKGGHVHEEVEFTNLNNQQQNQNNE